MRAQLTGTPTRIIKSRRVTPASPCMRRTPWLYFYWRRGKLERKQMADEITNLLEEVSGFEIPNHLQKFLNPERPPSESERSLSFFSYSYELAFLHLAASVKGRWRHNDLLKAPLFYLGRHSIELHLKYAIEQFAEYTIWSIRRLGRGLAGPSGGLAPHPVNGLWIRGIRSTNPAI
jgi:hypothetical protein